LNRAVKFRRRRRQRDLHRRCRREIQLCRAAAGTLPAASGYLPEPLS